MSFSNIIRKKPVFLVPFSWIYQAGVFFFHKLYDLKIIKSYSAPVPVICVGNLSVGGTGKSPMVEYIIGLFKNHYRLAVVSRGYRRKTNGFLLADKNTNASDIGDEPMQFHHKFPDITVAVGEKRAKAIQLLLKQKPDTELIILDDSYQHRAVTADLNILLTEYSNIFPNDRYLPAGSLRDLKSNYKRAQIIVVTKCNPGFSEIERGQILKLIQPLPFQNCFFTSIGYGIPYNIFTGVRSDLEDLGEVVLVTGIANPQPLVCYLKKANIPLTHLTFPDHHNFSEDDIRHILSTCKSDALKNKAILTTEKDAMRLKEWRPLTSIRLFVLPITHKILFKETKQFENILENLLKKSKA